LLTHPDVNAGEMHLDPHLLPHGNALIFTRIIRGQERRELVLLDLKAGTERLLLENAEDATYVPSGHLVFVRQNALHAAPFDLDIMSVTGTETPLGVSLSGSYAISPAGDLVYTESADGSDRSEARLVWMDHSGDETPLPIEPRPWSGTLRLSRDGRLLVGAMFPVSAVGTNAFRIWKYDFERSVLAPLTFDDARNRDPILSPDGRQVTYRSDRDGPMNIYRMTSDGSGASELLLSGEPNVTNLPEDWTPDGTTLLFVRRTQRGGGDELWTLKAPFGAEARPQRLLSAENIPDARVSPNGDFVAYTGWDAGLRDVYVVGLSGAGVRVQVSGQGGSGPMWSHDGKQLFYSVTERDQTTRLMAVDVNRTPSLSLGPPRQLAELSVGAFVLEVDGNGERFLVWRLLTASRRFVLVTNWTDEVARLVGKDQ